MALFPELLIDPRNDSDQEVGDDNRWFHQSTTSCTGQGADFLWQTCGEAQDWIVSADLTDTGVAEMAIPFAMLGIDPKQDHVIGVLPILFYLDENGVEQRITWPDSAEMNSRSRGPARQFELIEHGTPDCTTPALHPHHRTGDHLLRFSRHDPDRQQRALEEPELTFAEAATVAFDESATLHFRFGSWRLRDCRYRFRSARSQRHSLVFCRQQHGLAQSGIGAGRCRRRSDWRVVSPRVTNNGASMPFDPVGTRRFDTGVCHRRCVATGRHQISCDIRHPSCQHGRLWSRLSAPGDARAGSRNARLLIWYGPPMST